MLLIRVVDGLLGLCGVMLLLNLGDVAKAMATLTAQLPRWFVGPRWLVKSTNAWRVGGAGLALFCVGVIVRTAGQK
jgi:hypothetical protein